MPRAVMLVLAALALAVLGVALLGRLDIVVSAKGKLVPTERVKLIQPAVVGVVRNIAVKDGQRVKAGDVLMELDPAQAAADSSKARSGRIAAALAAARAQALLDAQSAGRLPRLGMIDGADASDLGAAQRLADGAFLEYRDKQANIQAALAKRIAELQVTRHDIDKLSATAPLARQQARDFSDLVEQRYVAKSEFLDREQKAIEQEHELAARMSHAVELEAGIDEQRALLAAGASQFRREQLDALDKASQQLTQLRGDEVKAMTRRELMTLRSPVAGTVQQLAIHTVGGVTTTAQTLMEIVPDDALEVEASVENKDVGFVHAGQGAIVKVEAFPYTHYGFLEGTVRSISNDAVADRKTGLSFVAHVALLTNRMRIDEQWVNLTPGMAVTAEVKTGTRSVARYFLEPLVQTSHESLNER